MRRPQWRLHATGRMQVGHGVRIRSLAELCPGGNCDNVHDQQLLQQGDAKGLSPHGGIGGHPSNRGGGLLALKHAGDAAAQSDAHLL